MKMLASYSHKSVFRVLPNAHSVDGFFENVPTRSCIFQLNFYYLFVLDFRMYTPLLLFTFLSLSFGMPMDDDAWREYKLKFGKFYKDDEEAGRYQIWRQQLKEILIHNEKSTTYKQGINNFTDMVINLIWC